MKISIRLIAAGALLAAGLPLTASAQTITINATVNSQCNIGNATVNLGALNLLSGTIYEHRQHTSRLTCNKGAHRRGRPEQRRQRVRNAEAHAA